MDLTVAIAIVRWSGLAGDRWRHGRPEELPASGERVPAVPIAEQTVVAYAVKAGR